MFTSCHSLVAAALFSLHSLAAAQIELTFEDREEAVVQAIASPLGDPSELIAVGLPSWNLVTAKVQGVQPKSITYDPMTGLLLIRVAEGLEVAPSKLGSSRELEPGTSLDAGDQVAAFAGFQTRIQDTTQPLTLLRVNFEEKVPPIGTTLTDGEGAIVGYVFQAVADRDKEAYAIPVEAAKRLQESFDKAGAAQRAWIGVSLDSDSSAPEVIGVRQQSPAAEAGLKKGDVILAIGDRTIGSFTDAVDAFYYMVPGTELEVTVLRGTTVVNLSVMPAVHPIQGA